MTLAGLSTAIDDKTYSWIGSSWVRFAGILRLYCVTEVSWSATDLSTSSDGLLRMLS